MTLKTLIICLAATGFLASGCGGASTATTAGTQQPPATLDSNATEDSATEDLNEDITPDIPAPKSATLVHTTYVVSNALILNPERGYFYWTDLLTSNFSDARELGYTLIYARVMLNDYVNKPLDDILLQKLDTAFQKVRQAGVKCILRFTYNDSQTGITDAPLALILQHIAQLKPVLGANADVIYTMQAGFIGAWGEWHTSTNGLDINTDAQKQILDAILDALPESRHIQVRTPLFKDAYVTLSGKTTPRMGHHNDCFLASDTDFGTYPSDAINFWKAFVANDDHALVGGETCNKNPPRTDCTAALAEMATLHYSFLNGSPWGGVIDEWKAQGCYDTINRQMGYRLELLDAELNDHVQPGKILHTQLTLQNSGIASLQYARTASLILQGAGKTYTTPLALDLSQITPNSKMTVEVNALLPEDIQEGSYTLSLWLPDPSPTLQDNPLYDIQLANENGNLVSSAIIVDAAATPHIGTSDSNFKLK